MSFYIKTHITQKGETLEDIISQYDIPEIEILRHFHNQNAPKDSNNIGSVVFAGQEIFIPGKKDIEKIIAERKIRAKEFSEKEQTKQFNQDIKFPFIRGNHHYRATLQEEGANDINSFTLHIEYIKTLDQLHYLKITQSEIKTNEDVPDGSVEILVSEINKKLYPIQIIVDEQGIIQSIDRIFTLRKNWDTKKLDLYEFFPGEVGAKLLDKAEEILSDSDKLACKFNLNIIWALLFRGITGKYENGESRKKISFIDRFSRFPLTNTILKKDSDSSQYYKIEQKIYEENEAEVLKAEVLYTLGIQNNIIQKAEITLFNMPENMNIIITKTE